MAYGVVVGGGALFRRERPDKTSAAKGSYANGAYINITNYDDFWYSTTFTYNGASTTGYVMKSYVAAVGDTVQVTGTRVNLRNGPGTSASILDDMSTPETGTVLGVARDSSGSSFGWCQLRASGKPLGWMRGDYLTRASSWVVDYNSIQMTGMLEVLAIDNGMVYDAPNTGAPTYTGFVGSNFVSRFTGSNYPDAWQEWMILQINGLFKFVQAKHCSQHPRGVDAVGRLAQVRVTSGGLNMRTRPSTSATVAQTIDNYGYVRVLDATSVSGWWRVIDSNGMGWVSTDYCFYV